MASSKWKTVEEINMLSHGRQVVFWGASNWVDRSLELLEGTIAYIVDQSLLNQGFKYCGYDVYSPKKLQNESPESIFIIISTANYQSVIDELDLSQFTMGDDYCVTPLLNQNQAKEEMITRKTNLYITSPQHYADSTSGGRCLSLLDSFR